MSFRAFSALPVLVLAALCGGACAQDSAPADAGSGGMVAAANPLAAEAGLSILRAGGGAADAAVAVQAALTLVEPQSSGIGGGAFLVHFDAETGAVTAYDGRETAPAAAGPELFFADGQILGFLDAWTSGRAVGAPGAVAMLGLAQADHGRLDWSELFGGAIALAEEGFAVSPRMAQSIAQTAGFGPLGERPATRAYFFTPEGAPLPAGHVLTNPAYARTLRILAEGGPGAFYEGAIAQGVVDAAAAPPLPGALTLADLAAYEAKRAPAVCGPYRVWLVCSAPPPSSGGTIVNAALGVLAHFDLSAGPDDAASWHLLIDALRLAYADRDAYVADPAFVDVPAAGMIDADYLASRAALIAPGRAIAHAAPGTPPGAPHAGADTTREVPGTSHFVIVDRWGDVVSMTTSVEAAFGSHRLTDGGFLLNNQMTDFAREAYDATGAPLANAAAGGKRPRSSMSPVIVLDRATGAFVLAVGSPGGNSIPSYVVKALVGMLDWGLTPQEAVDLPNIVARGDRTSVEPALPTDILEALRAMGHDIGEPRGENSGLHAIRLLPDGTLQGGADSRREGVAATP